MGEPDGGSAGRRSASPAPGHQAARRSRRSFADLPDGADPPRGLNRAGDRDPGAGAGGIQALAPNAALPGSAARARARYTGAHLLQVRRRLSARFAQAEHRGGAGVRERPRRAPEADNGDRRRPVGVGAGVRVPAVRAGVRGLDGRLELRPEAVPPLDDGDLGRDGPPFSVGRDRGRTLAARAYDRIARDRDLRGSGGGGAESRHELLAWLGAQPRAAAPDGDRPGGAGPDGDGR